MLLHDKIVLAYPAGFSGFMLYGPTEQIPKMKTDFVRNFNREWKAAVKKFEEEHDCIGTLDTQSPAIATHNGQQIFIRVLPLLLENKDIIDHMSGITAFTNAIEKLVQKYPEMEFEGALSFGWSAKNECNVINQAFSTTKDEMDVKLTFINGIFSEEILKVDARSQIFWNNLRSLIQQWDDVDHKTKKAIRPDVMLDSLEGNAPKIIVEILGAMIIKEYQGKRREKND